MATSGRSYPLIEYAFAGQAKRIQELITSGKCTDVNEEDDNGNCAVVGAVRANSVETLQVLIDNGANVDITDSIGRHVLDYAKKREFNAVAELLEKTIEEQSKLLVKTLTSGLSENKLANDSAESGFSLIAFK